MRRNNSLRVIRRTYVVLWFSFDQPRAQGLLPTSPAWYEVEFRFGEWWLNRLASIPYLASHKLKLRIRTPLGQVTCSNFCRDSLAQIYITSISKVIVFWAVDWSHSCCDSLAQTYITSISKGIVFWAVDWRNFATWKLKLLLLYHASMRGNYIKV